MMGQVLANLLKNAVEAVCDMPDGRVELSAYCNESDTVVMTVSDNGPHIPDEVANEIFVPFFTTKSTGTGVGLSISRRMVQLNGGSLTLSPYTGPDALTTFTINLP
jgi:C4-dicarboxylate-specific signal transduction histidine kinase